MFKIQFNVGMMKEALGILSTTVGKNAQNLGDDCISIKDNMDNTISMYTTNSVEYTKIDMSITMGMSDASDTVMSPINFTRFSNIINTMPDTEYVTIESGSSGINISYGLSKSPITLTVSTSGMLPFPLAAGTSLKGSGLISIDPEILKDECKAASKIIVPDKSSAINQCMKIEANNYDISFSAVDTVNNRMMYHKITTGDLQNGSFFMEPSKVYKILAKIVGKVPIFNTVNIDETTNGSVTIIQGTSLNLNSNYTGGIISMTYCLRNVTGNYPNIQPMFANAKNFVSVPIGNLVTELERVVSISDSTDADDVFNMEVNNNKITIKKTSQYGSISNDIECNNAVTTAKFTDNFKPKAMLDILNSCAELQENGNINIGVTTVNSTDYYIIKTDTDRQQFLISGYTLSSSSQSATAPSQTP